MNYKVVRCNSSKHKEVKVVDSCYFYHSEEDQRRCPIDKNQKIIFYTDILFQRNFKNCERLQFCLNLYEYNFHAFNLKKTQCIKEKILGTCTQKYCPFIHSNDNLQNLEEIRKEIQSYKYLNVLNPLPSIKMPSSQFIFVEPERLGYKLIKNEKKYFYVFGQLI